MLSVTRTSTDQDFEKRVIDITKDFNFSNLEVRPTHINKFYFFYNKIERCFGDTFILTDQMTIQRRCTLTLIKNEDGKLLPKLEFFIWNKEENRKVNKQVNETDNMLKIKARVELEKDGSENFWKLIGFLVTIKDIELKDFGVYRVTNSNAYI